MMNFLRVEDLQLNLTIDLIPLRRDSQSYKTFMYQHEGDLKARPERFCNENPPLEEFRKFFAKARNPNGAPDLVLTPEYSCPWTVIHEIITDEQKWPANHKLWVIGTESATPAELRSFRETYSGDNIIIHFEETINAINRNFVDSVIYLFKALQNGVSKLIVLIQFKTYHMGVWGGGGIERDNLIEGSQVYVLKNSAPALPIYFMTLICSEAMNFEKDITSAHLMSQDWEDSPFLVFHPQCNPKPSYEDFVDFRKFVFEKENKEIISLNWHQNSKINGTPIFTSSSPRSGFYIKSIEIDTNGKNRIKANHKLGLYYFNLSKHRHSYLINGHLHAVLADLPAVKIAEVHGIQSRRDGPRTQTVFSWDKVAGEFSELAAGISDDHIEYISKLGCINQFMINPHNCILEKERLVSLTAGRFNKPINREWFHLDRLYSVFMDDSVEVARRVTYIEENAESCTDEIEYYIDAINELGGRILIDVANIPDSIGSLREAGISIGYYPDAANHLYRYNVVTNTGENGFATILYVGTKPRDVVEHLHTQLQDLFDYNNKDRIVIYYKEGAIVKRVYTINAANILSDKDDRPDDILKN